jgi:four helix bundle protein
MKTNVMQEKSFAFAIRMIRLSKYLESHKENMIAGQVLRSGTSIGANIEEAIGGLSKKDFLLKISIAYKEARETHYWLKILQKTDILDETQSHSLISDCDELLRIIGSAQKTTKSRLNAG